MRDRLPFSHLLPLIDLALLVVLVFVPITLTAIHLYELSRGSDQVHLHADQGDIAVTRNEIVPLAVQTVWILALVHTARMCHRCMNTRQP